LELDQEKEGYFESRPQKMRLQKPPGGGFLFKKEKKIVRNPEKKEREKTGGATCWRPRPSK